MSNESEVEKMAREYAEKVCLHSIDSVRFAMANPFGVAKTDFLAGFLAGQQSRWIPIVRDDPKTWPKRESIILNKIGVWFKFDGRSLERGISLGWLTHWQPITLPKQEG